MQPRLPALSALVLAGGHRVHGHHVVLLELVVLAQGAEVDRVQAYPGRPGGVEAERGDADGLPIGLGRRRRRLHGDQRPHPYRVVAGRLRGRLGAGPEQ